mmetsp:Transcript_19322/g.45147  ORF Transcript_19322/g.45147 Transcript_19322/m.45147 type:complete len:136 (-) Transcript_19322:154-561(-)
MLSTGQADIPSGATMLLPTPCATGLPEVFAGTAASLGEHAGGCVNVVDPMLTLSSNVAYSIPKDQYARVMARREFKLAKYGTAVHRSQTWNFVSRHTHAATRPRGSSGKFASGLASSSTSPIKSSTSVAPGMPEV